MLAKDRNPTKPNFKAITETEKLVGEVASVVYDETKIPKRKRYIGERMLDHAVSAHENIRAANKTPLLKTRELANRRIELSSSAELEIMNLCTDIKLLPAIVSGSVQGNEKWYENISMHAVECKNITNKWVGSDMARADKYFAKLEEESSKPDLQECIRFHPIPYIANV